MEKVHYNVQYNDSRRGNKMRAFFLVWHFGISVTVSDL